MSQRFFFAFGILFSFLLGYSACTKKPRQAYGLDPAETLRVNLINEPPTLDWNKASDTTSSQVFNNIMEGLTDIDLQDPNLKAVPALAENWTTKDARVWEFTLRKNVRWTDGVPFTGQHVIDGWERLLNPKTAAKYAYQLYTIKNAKVYNEGKVTDFSQVGVKLEGENRLIVELEQPKAYFPYVLSHGSTYPIRKEIIAKYGERWTEPENIETLGPYELKVWDHDRAVVIERSETYYGRPPKMKYVLGYVIPELSTALSLYESGELDAIDDLFTQVITKLKKRSDYHGVNALTIYYYGFNTSKLPMNDIKVRRAIAMAINRKQVTDLLAGGEVPISGWLPQGMMGFTNEVGVHQNVEQARKLLDEAGYQDRKKFPKIKIGFNTLDLHQRVAENIQAQLKTNLGIDVELENEEWKTFIESLRSDPPYLFRMGWQADFPDPDNFMSLLTSYSDNNHTRWGNKVYDEIIKKAVSMTNVEERKKAYLEVQKILTETDVAVFPIYSRVEQFLISPRVRDYPLNVLKEMRYETVYFDEGQKSE